MVTISCKFSISGLEYGYYSCSCIAIRRLGIDNAFDGFEERRMLASEYAWLLRPEPKPAEFSTSSSKPIAQRLEEHCSLKRSTPWGAGDYGIIKHRLVMNYRTPATAARGVRALSIMRQETHRVCAPAHQHARQPLGRVGDGLSYVLVHFRLI